MPLMDATHLCRSGLITSTAGCDKKMQILDSTKMYLASFRMSDHDHYNLDAPQVVDV